MEQEEQHTGPVRIQIVQHRVDPLHFGCDPLIDSLQEVDPIHGLSVFSPTVALQWQG